ncbi:MAG TPA: M12 family metallo-peptidase [Mycobacteriales bacterium]|jgi:hypothetical protein
MSHAHAGTARRRVAGLLAGTAAALLVLSVGSAGGTAFGDEGETLLAPDYNLAVDSDVSNQIDVADAVVALPAADAAVSASGVGTHLLYVKVWADEEYRTHFGSNWRNAANNSLEKADDAMAATFGIDYRSTSYNAWSSYSGNRTPGSVLSEFSSESNYSGADIAFGFSKNFKPGSPGAAYRLGRYAVNIHIDQATDWKIVQHEVSHIFGAYDRYINYSCDNPNHEDDVMECPYERPNYWAAIDRTHVMANRARFR